MKDGSRSGSQIENLPQSAPLLGCQNLDPGYGSPVKFVLALLVYLVMGFILAWGILLTFKGNPWLLLTSFVVYALLFAKLGCLPKQSH